MALQTGGQTTVKSSSTCAPVNLEGGSPAVLSAPQHACFLLAPCRRSSLSDKISHGNRKYRSGGKELKTAQYWWKTLVLKTVFQFLLHWFCGQVSLGKKKKSALWNVSVGLHVSSFLDWFLYEGLNAVNHTEIGVTDRLQNYNLISREHLYGDTNQTTGFPLSRLIKSAWKLKRQKERRLK